MDASAAETAQPTATWGVGSIARYEEVAQIGEGTYGKVFRAKDKLTGDIVALKKMLKHHESEGFPRTETREIKLLKSVQHPHMIRLREVVTSFGCFPGSDFGGGEAPSLTAAVMGDPPPAPTTTDRLGEVYMCFDWCDYDLAGLIDSGYAFTMLQVKSYIYQLLCGLDHLHSQCGFLHRDLKCSNLLLTNDHVLKLADFGLSRLVPPAGTHMTNKVVTLWYRAPEVLLGETQYGPGIDMWSVGCIMLELITGRPPFPAKAEAEQTRNIFKVVGAPPAESYLRSLPLWPEVAPDIEGSRPRLSEWLARSKEVSSDKDALSLLLRLLEPDPRLRMSAREALQAPWFFAREPRLNRERPWQLSQAPARVSDAPSFQRGVDLHEFTSRVRRKEAGAAAGGAEPPTEAASAVVAGAPKLPSGSPPPSAQKQGGQAQQRAPARPPAEYWFISDADYKQLEQEARAIKSLGALGDWVRSKAVTPAPGTPPEAVREHAAELRVVLDHIREQHAQFIREPPPAAEAPELLLLVLTTWACRIEHLLKALPMPPPPPPQQQQQPVAAPSSSGGGTAPQFAQRPPTQPPQQPPQQQYRQQQQQQPPQPLLPPPPLHFQQQLQQPLPLPPLLHYPQQGQQQFLYPPQPFPHTQHFPPQPQPFGGYPPPQVYPAAPALPLPPPLLLHQPPPQARQGGGGSRWDSRAPPGPPQGQQPPLPPAPLPPPPQRRDRGSSRSRSPDRGSSRQHSGGGGGQLEQRPHGGGGWRY